MAGAWFIHWPVRPGVMPKHAIDANNANNMHNSFTGRVYAQCKSVHLHTKFLTCTTIH